MPTDHRLLTATGTVTRQAAGKRGRWRRDQKSLYFGGRLREAAANRRALEARLSTGDCVSGRR